MDVIGLGRGDHQQQQQQCTSATAATAGAGVAAVGSSLLQLLDGMSRWLPRVLLFALYTADLRSDVLRGGTGGTRGAMARGFSTQMSVTVVDTQYGKLKGVLTTLPGRNLPQVKY